MSLQRRWSAAPFPGELCGAVWCVAFSADGRRLAMLPAFAAPIGAQPA